MENRSGGKYMTGNVAYVRDIILAIGGLNESLSYLSDRALGLEVNKRYGRVCFNESMVVFHPWTPITSQKILKVAPWIEDRVFLFRMYGDRELLLGRIMNVRQLALLLCPELIFASFLLHSYRKKEDYRLLPFTFIAAIVERLHIWKASAINRVFII
jgi:hypothetical protein